MGEYVVGEGGIGGRIYGGRIYGGRGWDMGEFVFFIWWWLLYSISYVLYVGLYY